mgnify:CR=1 FL=1
MVMVNGQATPQAVGQTIAHFLASNGFDLSRVAVEYNGEIVSKDSYAQQYLANGDVLEVVTFVGGG